MEKYSNLKFNIEKQIQELKKGIKGHSVMTVEIDQVYNDLLTSKIPVSWKKYSYLSLKPLGSWITDLNQRLDFMKGWMVRTKMDKYMISCFFFPHGFLTAIRIQYSRDNKIPLNTVILSVSIKDPASNPKASLHTVIISGLFMEGANLNLEGYLIEQTKKETHPSMPYFELIPILQKGYDNSAMY